MTNTGTGRAVTAETNGSGEYTVNALSAGKYHIDVKSAGFKTAAADFTLEVSQAQEISLKLETGEIGTTVDVTSDVPLVDTATSGMGEVIHGREVTELPLNGRNFTQLALLAPGVTRGAYGDEASGGSSGTNSETFRNSETGGAALSANGLRPQADNFLLDGVDNNDALVNTIVFFPPAEAIQEFRVTTSVATAEYGRGGGAILETSTKSGTNALHGSVFLFRRSGFGAAHDYHAPDTPIQFRQAQFGGTLGGGWQWNNIVTLQTGTPFDLNVTGNSPQNRPDITGPISAKVSDGQGIITGDLTAPPVNADGVYTRPGTLGRNFLYGPGVHTWDTGMSKSATFAERYKVEFRADFFNLLNHPQFQNASFNMTALSTIASPGVATTRFSSARQMQLALRFTF